ncbi:MAG TPA: 2-dehydropantoate 2-reductase N-terminal domain-containing protein [Candidatus Paceibacterota bacterium]|nr:2-dehydropantoate 2-reductase N-terminal domain-containing protein [Candidatus Pacearchaeota archaeon]HRZ51432.1 2-dehydropantoate 2-reductase N-terminal domain-containing protein [Candidatus Paceibacterota bacterium]HSA37167.1 2-dehydropantoate 2-reductase N-terminal domain-containing protein [Candidatus Paceibacterota bacterium]
MNKTVLIVGAGGRTGAMFSEELKKACRVFGVGLDREIDQIEEKKIVIKKNGEILKYSVNTVRSWEFEKVAADIAPDFIFLATKNPVGETVKYYYRNFRFAQKIPVLVLSQNGLSAANEAREALGHVLESEAAKVKIIRLSLFNPIAADVSDDGTFNIIYSLPIKLAYGVHSGGEDASDLREIFLKTEMEVEEVAPKDTRNMEYTKLFMNLIGMASAVKGKSVKDGFRDREIFAQEINVLREYAAAVKNAGGKFLNFSNYPYPIGTMAWAVSVLPLPMWSLFRSQVASIVGSKRNDKPKDIGEIDYYNGEVVRLAKLQGRQAPENEKVYESGKAVLKKN